MRPSGELDPAYGRFTVRAVAAAQLLGFILGALLLTPIVLWLKPGPVVVTLAYVMAWIVSYYVTRQALRFLFMRSALVRHATRTGDSR